MGRKCKHRSRERDEKILKKLRRLEKEICSRRRHDSSDSEPRSDHENQTSWHNEYENTYCSPNNDIYYETGSPQPAISPEPAVNTEIPQTSLEKEVKSADNDQQPGTSGQNDESDVLMEEITHLDDEILSLLGDPPKEQSPVGPDVYNDIASRLQDVLQKGLKKDQKDKMIEDYPIPGNCPFFAAPLLNAEVKAAISDLLQKKDASFAARQRQVGTALTALVKLNNKLKDTLKESKRDKSLFGEDLAEKLKATKAIARSSQDLRYNKPKSMVMKNSASSSPQFNLNWKRPQPNYQNPDRRPPPPHRSAGAPSAPQYRSRAEADGRRRPPAPRARENAHYKRRY